MKLVFPLILIVCAIGLFTLYTNAAYQGPGGITTLQAKVAEFDGALDKAQELRRRRDELISKRNTFAAEDLQKLERILPDNVDNIRFVIDINGIAARRNLSLRNVSLGTISDARTSRATIAVGASGDPVGSAEISFSVLASYDEFLAFLQDLEHSLRIVDVEKISFKPGPSGDRYDFSLTIRTYWLH